MPCLRPTRVSHSSVMYRWVSLAACDSRHWTGQTEPKLGGACACCKCVWEGCGLARCKDGNREVWQYWQCTGQCTQGAAHGLTKLCAPGAMTSIRGTRLAGRLPSVPSCSPPATGPAAAAAAGPSVGWAAAAGGVVDGSPWLLLTPGTAPGASTGATDTSLHTASSS